MGKQIGPFKIEGRTFGRLVFYKMDGNYYVRTKSSLTGKRVKKDPRFRRTMRSADQLGRASKIGSAVYKALPKDFRQFWMYRAFTGEAMMMLKKGILEQEVLQELMKVYVEAGNKEQKDQERTNAKQIKYEIKSTINKGQALFYGAGRSEAPFFRWKEDKKGATFWTATPTYSTYISTYPFSRSA